MPCLYRSLFGFEFIPSVCRCGILTWPQGVWSSWTWYQRVGRKVKANSNPEVTKQDMCPCQLWHFCVLCCHQWWCVLFSFFFHLLVVTICICHFLVVSFVFCLIYRFLSPNSVSVHVSSWPTNSRQKEQVHTIEKRKNVRCVDSAVFWNSVILWL